MLRTVATPEGAIEPGVEAADLPEEDHRVPVIGLRLVYPIPLTQVARPSDADMNALLAQAGAGGIVAVDEVVPAVDEGHSRIVEVSEFVGCRDEDRLLLDGEMNAILAPDQSEALARLVGAVGPHDKDDLVPEAAGGGIIDFVAAVGNIARGKDRIRSRSASGGRGRRGA